MMNTENIDVVSVLTESGNHAKNCIELARYGAHIVVEKPMALQLDDAKKMIRACEENNVRLFIVKQNRFNLPVLALRDAIDSGRFGKLIMGTVRVRWCRDQNYYDESDWRGTWAMDGGVLTNQASHHIDLLEWMLGEAESVYAKGGTFLANIEAEDTAVVVVKFKSGAIGIIEATTAMRPKDLEGSLSIIGEFGAVEIGGFAVNEMKHWNFVNENKDDEDVRKNCSTNPPNVYGFGHKEYYDHVVDCLINNKPQLVDGKEGLKSLELINAIYESIETSKEVKLGAKLHNTKLGK
jgi:UDP-N-acetyl-2-amino-2-deoxyglucuronate dehydrogenase